MGAAIPDMRFLLERAGFRIKMRRADCIHCDGHSRGTVSFTDRVAYCHRCQWKANIFTLARELGLLSRDPRRREAVRQEQEHRRRLEAPIRAFEQWRDTELRSVTNDHRMLSRMAAVAENILMVYRDCEPAWEALARYCHRRATLNASLDYLTCAKSSDFLETPYTIVQLFSDWGATDHATQF